MDKQKPISFENQSTSAHFSDDRKHRYLLFRIWDNTRPLLVWAMLNPSTADETNNDPTITRCITFSRRWGYGGIVVWNIFALRSTDPKALYKATDPVGKHNKSTLQSARCICSDSIFNYKQSDTGHKRDDILVPTIVCAWGNHGDFMGQGETALEWMLDLKFKTTCLGQTKNGNPKHPLYIHGNTTLEDYMGKVDCEQV